VSKSASRARLAEIIRKRSFGRGEITLASGRKSDFYFNLKPTMLDPEGAALLAELTFEALKDDGLDYVGGLEMGAVPLAGAIAQLSWIKGHPIAAFFVRKKPKEHGARLAVEGLAKGESLQGKRVVIVEDVTTTGESALKAVEAARDAGGVKEGTEPGDRGRADHGAPAAGEVVIGDVFQDQHFGERIGLGAAHVRAQLEAEQAVVAQRLHRLGRERAELFALRARLAQDRRDARDGVEQHFAFSGGVGGEFQGHGGRQREV